MAGVHVVRTCCFIPFTILVLLPSAATASDADVLKKFGMWGHLAVDCGARHSCSNPHFRIFATPEGKITYTVVQGRNRENGTIHNPRLLTSERLEYKSGGITDTWVKIEGKFRLQRMVRADGTIYVEDGRTTTKTPQAREPTHTFMVCGS